MSLLLLFGSAGVAIVDEKGFATLSDALAASASLSDTLAAAGSPSDVALGAATFSDS